MIKYNLINCIPNVSTSINNGTNIIFTVVTVLLRITRVTLLGNLDTSFIA